MIIAGYDAENFFKETGIPKEKWLSIKGQDAMIHPKKKQFIENFEELGGFMVHTTRSGEPAINSANWTNS